MDHTGWWVDLSKWFWYPKVTEKQHLPVGGFAVPFLERIGAVQRSDRIWSLVEKRWIQWCFVIDSTDVFISHFVPLTLAQKERKIGYVEFFKEMNKFTNEIWNYLGHKKQKKIFVRRDRVLWTKKALEPLAFIFVVCSWILTARWYFTNFNYIDFIFIAVVNYENVNSKTISSQIRPFIYKLKYCLPSDGEIIASADCPLLAINQNIISRQYEVDSIVGVVHDRLSEINKSWSVRIRILNS